jgi:hypothetical protein
MGSDTKCQSPWGTGPYKSNRGLASFRPPVYVSGMDLGTLVAFHKSWLGKTPKHTPKSLWVAPQQIQLYSAFPNARGFSSKDKDETLFLGTLVLVLAQSRPGSRNRVFLLVPRSHTKWVWAQIESIARYMVRARKDNAEGIELVKDVLGQVFVCETPYNMQDEPARWASFGFCKDDPLLPEWVTSSLIEVSDG